MPTYYLDIETTGLNSAKDSIITIQYRELERYTGKPKGRLHILTSWESDNQDISDRFVHNSSIGSQDRFAFIPIGYNLAFENKFLYHSTGINILDLPHIDLHHTAILMNHGEFRGSGLDKMSRKRSSGANIPDLYSMGRYDEIIQYVEHEAAEFCDFYMWLLERLPAVHKEFMLAL